MSASSAPKEVFDELVAAFNGRDERNALQLASPDIKLVAPGGLDFEGKDGLRQWFDLWREACPDYNVNYYNVVASGEQVMGEGTFTGTHTGVLHLPAGDVPATGRSVKADYSAFVRVKDGQVTYLRHYFDVMDMMIQLGLIPAPATA